MVCVRVQEQFRHGKSHDIAAADHHGALAGDLHACGPQPGAVYVRVMVRTAVV